MQHHRRDEDANGGNQRLEDGNVELQIGAEEDSDRHERNCALHNDVRHIALAFYCVGSASIHARHGSVARHPIRFASKRSFSFPTRQRNDRESTFTRFFRPELAIRQMIVPYGPSTARHMLPTGTSESQFAGGPGLGLASIISHRSEPSCRTVAMPGDCHDTPYSRLRLASRKPESDAHLELVSRIDVLSLCPGVLSQSRRKWRGMPNAHDSDWQRS